MQFGGMFYNKIQQWLEELQNAKPLFPQLSMHENTKSGLVKRTTESARGTCKVLIK